MLISSTRLTILIMVLIQELGLKKTFAVIQKFVLLNTCNIAWRIVPSA
jgi:hypothetical protein